MNELVPPPDSAVDLGSLPLSPLDAGEGAPATRWSELGPLSAADGTGATIGVWEMEPGVAFDTEEDEVFVVLSGEGVIAFLDADAELVLAPGVLVRLAAGSRTRWTVTRTVRKLYVTV